MPNSQRTRRIDRELQRVLAEIIARDVKDPRVGNVTITAVAMSRDMGSARVHFVPFSASAHSPDEVREGLTRAGGFLRGEVGRRLGLRHAPKLEFIFDESLDHAAHLTRLIDDAVARDIGDKAADDVEAPVARDRDPESL